MDVQTLIYSTLQRSQQFLQLIYSAISKPGSPQVLNVPIDSASVEQTITLPNNVRKFTIKARGGALQVSFSKGDSNTHYILLADGQALSESDILFRDAYLYMQSSTAGMTAEIVYWRLTE